MLCLFIETASASMHLLRIKCFPQKIIETITYNTSHIDVSLLYEKLKLSLYSKAILQLKMRNVCIITIVVDFSILINFDRLFAIFR